MRRTDPDYDAIRSRAFGYLIGKAGVGVTQKKIDEAIEAGCAELRHDRRRGAVETCEQCERPALATGVRP